MPPKAGTRYTYSHDTALGHAHMPAKAATTRKRAVDPDVPDDDPTVAGLHRDMHELDMHPGTEVTAYDYDRDRDLVLVEWTDRVGTPRITSVVPDRFAEHFTKG